MGASRMDVQIEAKIHTQQKVVNNKVHRLNDLKISTQISKKNNLQLNDRAKIETTIRKIY